MEPKFLDVDRETLYLLPPSVQDWLPEGHLARFVVEIVEQLDLRSLKESYAGRGSQPYNPAMLLALLFYGYSAGVFSSRKLERSTYDSAAFRFIAANRHPDHDTIATFRKRFLKELSVLFVQILMIARQMNMLKLGSVSLDGSKIKANASKHKALSYEHACKLETQLKSEVAELLKRAESADKADIPDGMNVPEELQRREQRLSGIAAAKAEIERRAAERHTREQAAYEEKVAARAKKTEETGKKPKGKQPKPPTAGPTSKDQVNLTDEESRIMPVSGGGFEQTYNAQAAVDTESKLIVAAHITQQSNYKQELISTLKNLVVLPKQLGTITELLADSGYFSETNVNACVGEEITPYIAVDRQSHIQYNLPVLGVHLATESNRKEVAQHFPDTQVRKIVQIDLAMIDAYDDVLKALEWDIEKTARRHDWHSLLLLRSIHGVGQILGLVMLYEIHYINRFESVQDFASYCRLVKCSHESAGKKKGTGGAKIGNAHLKWAFSEAALLLIRYNSPAKKLVDNLAKLHGKGKAIGIMAHKLARAIYYMLKYNTPFNLEKFMATA